MKANKLMALDEWCLYCLSLNAKEVKGSEVKLLPPAPGVHSTLSNDINKMKEDIYHEV